MAYGDFKDLNRETAAETILCNKASNFAENLKWDISKDLFQWFINFSIKKLLME